MRSRLPGRHRKGKHRLGLALIDRSAAVLSGLCGTWEGPATPTTTTRGM